MRPANQNAACLTEADDIATPVRGGEVTGPESSRRGEEQGNDTATLHELANSITAVLVHAQVLEWRLPPYSRLKRPVREIERHARRSGALLRRLLGQCEPGLMEMDEREFCGPVPSLHGIMAAVMAQGPGTTARRQEKWPSLAPPSSAPGSFSPETELTSPCDLCTSTLFPKEERYP
jgi:hypothetical protein